MVMNNEAYTLIVNASLQICIGQEALGDVYKKMKKYKLSERSYQEAAKELKKISEIKPGGQLKDETFETTVDCACEQFFTTLIFGGCGGEMR